MIKTQTLKGFRDFLPKEARKRQYVINILKDVFESYGFEPLETPALEYEEVLLGKYGEEGDKLMYRFEDNGKRKVALRYDQTVPTSRVVAQYQNVLPMPFKRYQIQPVWRAENTQKGRFREFLQCDADIIGTVNPLSDAEIIKVATKALEALGFNKFKVLLNDRNVFYGIDGNEFKFNISQIRILDKLKKIGRDAVIEELIKQGTNNDWAIQALDFLESLKKSPPLLPIFPALEKLGVPKDFLEFTPTLARGLDYYTGTIFEIEIDGYTAGSVCGGGRYDKMIGMFAGKDITAVGFAFGFDRLVEAMEELKLFPDDLQTTKVLVTIFPASPDASFAESRRASQGGSPDLLEKSLEITSKLRSNSINTEIYLDENAKIEKQLKYADQKGIPYAIIIGPEEAEKNTVTLKNLKTREQNTIPVENLILKLQ